MGYRPKAVPQPRPPGSREAYRSLVGPPPWIMRGENAYWSFVWLIALVFTAAWLIA